MKKFRFIGRVLPEFPKRVSYPVVPNTNPMKAGTLGFEIKRSIVSAELTIDDIENAVTALKSVEHVIQGLVDAYSFIAGNTYEVRMEAIKQDDEAKAFQEPTIGELLPDVLTQELPKTEQLMSLAIEHMNLRFALSNFKNAKRYTAYTGFYIYLSIENIKKHFYPTDLKNEEEEWEGLREQLTLTRENIDFAKTFADKVRHGSYQDVAGTDNTKILKLGAAILYKFYKYLITR